MRRRQKPYVPRRGDYLRVPRYAGPRSWVERQWTLLKAQYGGVLAAAAEVAPYLAVPLALFFLWATDGALLAWVALMLLCGLRYALRSHNAYGVADKLMSSGLVLLPEEDVVVQEFIHMAEARHVDEMIHSLHEHAVVEVFDMRHEPVLNGRTGVIKGFYQGRAIVIVDGIDGMKLISPQNLCQEIDVGGRRFTYSRCA